MNLRNGFEKLLLVLHFSLLSFFEKLLLVLGLLFLSCYVAARIDGLISSRTELKRFWQAREEQSSARPSASSGQDKAQPDFQLWSEKRIAAYKLSLSSSAPPALAVLQIPRMNLESASSFTRQSQILRTINRTFLLWGKEEDNRITKRSSKSSRRTNQAALIESHQAVSISSTEEEG